MHNVHNSFALDALIACFLLVETVQFQKIRKSFIPIIAFCAFFEYSLFNPFYLTFTILYVINIYLYQLIQLIDTFC